MDVLEWSRLQFGTTAGFHILWPLMSIGLSLFMVVMEAMWLKTKEDKYYRQLRFWTKVFILTFAIGTATGFPLEFEFG
ncbi:MAG: cytochrome ubiquinol oxidase subunit, partial [Parcubacteria group bacterium]|nr:cytochrome ubiquinol oxidase subunit [Parcubacteria group bacterium]